MKFLGIPKACQHSTSKKKAKGCEMDANRLADPFFILRFWISRKDTTCGGHVSFAQDDGTYLGGYWEGGVFVRCKSLRDDVERMGCSPSLTLKLFYHSHLPKVGAIKTWIKNALIGQRIDPEVTCASYVYGILQTGGSTISNVDTRDVNPVVLRELVFQMIRCQIDKATY